MQHFKQLTSRIWYQTPVSETDRPILAVVRGEKHQLMIDAGNSSAHAALFLEEMKKHNLGSPDLLALTHWHWDHIFGMKHLRLPSMATQQTITRMKEVQPYAWTDAALQERMDQGIEIPFCADAIKLEFGTTRDIEVVLPTIGFTGQLEIDLGGVQCQLIEVENDHSPGSLLVYIPEERVVFLGDAMYADIFSSKWNYTVERTTRLLAAIDRLEADYYVWSHGEAMSKSEFEEEVNMLRRAIRVTEATGGRLKDMRILYAEETGRSLTEDETETLIYFANGVK
ncbi:MBL fold metallo-hydrolase [Exiguobacterium sp. Leaf196]|jgi:glyoxylase-like metal-dependent hydrolase (beta-lactamase superfamily II)|uniref:MBL fold metallo-hydrolase n=1 Tax=Exiguobacterium sp. Leaf196 TaxID=1736298 RepID=UPI0006F7656E|nr:MBL fold metallo-hydrolase [Exiguobacterium sp. Leaf196]KQS37661.1 Zn-dependent hydrolase [Exiguobacterium sp. Leaf196]